MGFFHPHMEVDGKKRRRASSFLLLAEPTLHLYAGALPEILTFLFSKCQIVRVKRRILVRETERHSIPIASCQFLALNQVWRDQSIRAIWIYNFLAELMKEIGRNIVAKAYSIT